MEKCLCGKEATHTADLPIGNIYLANGKEACEEHKVCDYHAEKAKKLGYYTKKIIKPYVETIHA